MLIDGPSKDATKAVSKQEIPLSEIQLTPLLLEKLPKGSGSGVVAKFWEKNEIDSKWDQTSWAKKSEQQKTRQNLSDFERFKVMRLKKRVSSDDIAEA